MTFTKNQIDMMKHTFEPESNRNWFGCDSDSEDGKEFEILVENGYAKKRPARSWMIEDTVYSLTQKGIDHVNSL